MEKRIVRYIKEAWKIHQFSLTARSIFHNTTWSEEQWKKKKGRSKKLASLIKWLTRVFGQFSFPWNIYKHARAAFLLTSCLDYQLAPPFRLAPLEFPPIWFYFWWIGSRPCVCALRGGGIRFTLFSFIHLYDRPRDVFFQKWSTTRRSMKLLWSFD